jgi:alpha-mannosidase
MDKLFIIPHTHYDAEVFLTREEYLEVGYKVIFDALNLLKADPDYKYSLDQSAFIEPFLKAYPELRDTFVEMVACGRLEMIGGMEVMGDLNVTSGESIIRQFAVGKGFFQRELGVDVKTGWMIDTFGHCLQMPQIMKKCGFEHYAFSRVASVDKSEFYWQGIDGSRIATHWMPLHYGVFSDSPAWFSGFCEFARGRYKKLKPFAATSAIAAPEGGDFTHPLRHDPEFVRRWNEQTDRPFDLCIGTPGDFFAEVLKDKDKLPVITDDFNPVFQGCYSARIAMKQQNRLMETLLYDAEVWDGFAGLAGAPGVAGTPCQSRLIRRAWELMLFSQVHDVIGGVQMDKVNQNVQKRFIESSQLAAISLEESLDALVEQIDTRGEGIPLVVFNSLAWARTDKVTADIAYDTDDVFAVAVADSRGSHARLQVQALERYPNGAIKQARLLFMAACPATGYEVFHVLKNVESPWQNPWNTGLVYGMEELNEARLENEFYILKADLWKGCITSLVLKETGEELIDPALPYGNMLVQDEDNGDFWEIGTPLRGGANHPIGQVQPLNMAKATGLSIEKGGSCGVTEGNVCTEFTFVQKVQEYEFISVVRLYAGLARVEIESTLTNRQKNVRYRVALPTPIRSGTITQEIPFGSLVRPEGEYPAINWNDFSEPGRGLGVLNCGLPGNSVVDGKMMLSILKCTSFVSYGEFGGFSMANSSEGGHELNVPHTFRYALAPHKGDWREAGLPRQGLELNHPLTVRKTTRHGGMLPASCSFLAVEHNQAVVTAALQDGSGLLVRVYESDGKPADGVKLAFSFAPVSVAETDMLGNPMAEFDPVALEGCSVFFRLKPFEVRTFRVTY